MTLTFPVDATVTPIPVVEGDEIVDAEETEISLSLPTPTEVTW